MLFSTGLSISSKHSNKLGISEMYSSDSAGVIKITLKSSSREVNSVVKCKGVKTRKQSKSRFRQGTR